MSYKVEYDSNGLNMRKTWWYNNGNKSKLVTFKDGKIIRTESGATLVK